MRSALIAACALLAAAPAWGQTKKGAEPERKPHPTDVLDDVDIRFCAELEPPFLAFSKDEEGVFRLVSWPIQGEWVRFGQHDLLERDGALFVISEKRVVRISEGEVREFPCHDSSWDLFVLLMQLDKRAAENR